MCVHMNSKGWFMWIYMHAMVNIWNSVTSHKLNIHTAVSTVRRCKTRKFNNLLFLSYRNYLSLTFSSHTDTWNVFSQCYTNSFGFFWWWCFSYIFVRDLMNWTISDQDFVCKIHFQLVLTNPFYLLSSL